MSDVLILGTDTNAGKTTFALLWMSAFADDYEYWKPLETGEPDSATIRNLVPRATVHPSILSFKQPVAPLLAARLENLTIPAAAVIAASCPTSKRAQLVESFGGPFSPLNETELQIELIRELTIPCVLVTSAAVGAVTRSLQCLRALAADGIVPRAVVLMGPDDPFAVEQICRNSPGTLVRCIQPPAIWDVAGVAEAAVRAAEHLLVVRTSLSRRERTGEMYGSRTPNLEQSVQSIINRDRQAVWHPYTSLGDAAELLVCVGAQDEFLHLADGRRVIDAISSWWTILHGHRHPVLMDALEQACQQFDHVHFAGVTHEPAVALAELMLAAAPWPGGKVFYSDNGSTAVEVGLKMAYQYWCHRGESQRTNFVGFEHGYHGDTFGAMAVGRDPVFFNRFEPLLFQASIVPVSPERLDEELNRTRGKTAAVIIEPLVQAAGGMRMHTPALLHELAQVARRHDVLFIADEVMTGCGRTGTLWAYQAAKIVPDLICVGKTLAGGLLPLAATLAAPHVVQEFQTNDRSKTFFHGHSFTAHPLACAVAVASCTLLLNSSMAASARIEAIWRAQLSELHDLPQIKDLRIRGTIAAVELAGEGGYLANVGRRVHEASVKRGVLLRPLGNVVYAMPPLLTSLDSLAQIADTIKEAVKISG